MSHTVADYGLRANRTGYAGLVYVHELPGLWRYWDTSSRIDGMSDAAIGMQYPTRATLLADLHTFAAERGYERE